LAQDSKPKFFYGYTIIIAGFCIQLVSWGVYYTFGLFLNPIHEEFGWSWTTISLASSIVYLVLGSAGIIVGRLSDRFGPRMVMVGCGACLGVGYLLMSQISTVWQLYLFYGVIVALGLSGMDVLPLSATARWFVKRRGMMSGIVKVGTGVGMIIMPLVANRLITNYGWHDSYLIIGTIVLAAIIALAQLLRRDPAEKGLQPYGVNKDKAGVSDSVEWGLSLHEAIHTRQFWILAGMCALFNSCTQMTIVHIAPHSIELGMTAAGAASIMSIIGGASITGRFLLGNACDRIGSRMAMVISIVVLLGALIWLQQAGEAWMLYPFAAIYGFAHGGFFALLSPLVAELFGLKSHGELFGAVFFAGTIGGAMGPPLAGRIFDTTGSYFGAFRIFTALSGGALALSSLLKPVVRKEVINGSEGSA
jgi:MFS family permease